MLAVLKPWLTNRHTLPISKKGLLSCRAMALCRYAGRDLMPTEFQFEWLFLISVAAGFVGAMSGMGGGVVLIPALTLFHMDIKKAIAISIVSVIATSSGSAAAYVRDRITNLKVGMFLEMFTITGALVGAALTVIAVHQVLFLLFGLVLLGTAVTL